MKRIFIGAATALLMLAACETLEPVQVPDSSLVGISSGSGNGGVSTTDSVIVTANLDATKTYLEYSGGVYKQKWSVSDQILVWDLETLEQEEPTYEFFKLFSGEYSSTAEFVGTLQADYYVALYADSYSYPYNGYPSITLPLSQYYGGYDNLRDYQNPMIAISNNRDFYFQNICSVLKVSVTGNGEALNCITVYSQDGEPMAGRVILNIVNTSEGYEPVMEFVGEGEDDGVYSWVDYWCNGVKLSDEPMNFYIVVPAQTYAGGLGLALVTTDGQYMDVSTAAGIETKRSQMHEISVNFENEGEEVEGYARCQLELVGTSVASGTADASSWKWGNVLMADNSGYPTVDGATYTWTWNTYLYDESDCVSNMSGTPGFKIRTPDYLESGGVAAFDLGYGSVDTDASSVVSSYDLDNIMVGESGLYDVTLTYDAYSDEFTITLLLTSLQ